MSQKRGLNQSNWDLSRFSSMTTLPHVVLDCIPHQHILPDAVRVSLPFLIAHDSLLDSESRTAREAPCLKAWGECQLLPC